MGKSGKRGSGRAAKAAKAGLFTLAIAAFVVVCTGIGKLHASPFAPLAIEGASLASSDDAGTVVVDQGGTRLLFASPAGELRGLYGMAGRETPIDEVSLVRQVGNDVLVAGVKRAEDGERIKTEAVIRFDMSGTYKGVVWRRDYQDDEVRVTRSIADVECDADGNVLLVTFADQQMHALQFDAAVTRLGRDGAEDTVLREAVHPADSCPYDVRLDATSGRLAMSDIFGIMHIERGQDPEATPVSPGGRDLAVQSFDLEGDTAVLYDEKSLSLIRVDDLFGEARPSEIVHDTRSCDSISVCGTHVATVDSDGVVRLLETSGEGARTIGDLPLSTSLRLGELALYASYGYLSLLTLVLVIRWAVRAVRSGERAKVRNVVVAVSVTLICGAALVVHLADLTATTVKSRQSAMAQIASQASVTSPAEFGEAATKVAQRLSDGEGVDGDADALGEVILNVEGILASSFANTNGVQCSVYALDGEGTVRVLLDNQRDSIVVSQARGDELSSACRDVVQKVRGYEGDGVKRAYRFAHEERARVAIRDDRGGHEVISCVAPLIARDGSCCCAIEVTCHAESLIKNILENMGGIVLLFAMIAASIYVVSDELLRSGSAYLRFRELQKEGVEWAETLLGRPLAFVVNLAYGMDAAFAVVIAKDMLAGSDIAKTSMVWGIPALAIAVGTTLGTLVHATMSSRVAGRTYALTLTLVGGASMAVAGVAAARGWFVAFVACKLFSSASLAGLSLVYQNLAGTCQKKDLGDPRLQVLLSRSSVNIAAKGAGVVASVVGGALAIFGNQWVYAGGAVATLAVVPIVLIALPRGRVISSRDERVNLASVFEFLRSPVMLATLAFAIFPTVLASGYKSYILPLFLDAAGISKTDISSLFALGNVLLFAFTEPLINRRDATGRWKLTWVALIGLGALFSLFAFNQTPTWAVVAVVAITVLLWLAGDWKHTARGWAREDFGFAFDQSQSMLNLENALVQNAQAPVLSALVTLGATPCCLVLGVFLAISGVGYWLPTRTREG